MPWARPVYNCSVVRKRGASRPELHRGDGRERLEVCADEGRGRDGVDVRKTEITTRLPLPFKALERGAFAPARGGRIPSGWPLDELVGNTGPPRQGLQQELRPTLLAPLPLRAAELGREFKEDVSPTPEAHEGGGPPQIGHGVQVNKNRAEQPPDKCLASLGRGAPVAVEGGRALSGATELADQPLPSGVALPQAHRQGGKFAKPLPQPKACPRRGWLAGLPRVEQPAESAGLGAELASDTCELPRILVVEVLKLYLERAEREGIGFGGRGQKALTHLPCGGAGQVHTLPRRGDGLKHTAMVKAGLPPRCDGVQPCKRPESSLDLDFNVIGSSC